VEDELEPPTALGAVDSGIDKADGDDKTLEKEHKAVKRARDEYDTARSFDEPRRREYHRDRKYAAGKSDRTWKSNANIIGSHIDILKSFIYAKNPDVSCRPPPQAGGTPTEDQVNFSETAQIVVSRLWGRAKLKKRARRQVGSTLTVGIGGIKALMYTDKRPDPQLEKELKDSQDNLARITQLQTEIAEGADGDPDELEAKAEELNNQITGLQAKIEKLVRKGMCLDFMRAEDFQCSMDVASIADHLDADWNSNDIYIRKDQLRTRFNRLKKADVASATTYYQAAPRKDQPSLIYTGEDPREEVGTAEGAFTKSRPGQSSSGLTQENGKPVEFAKVTEMWCRSENVIKTFIDGVKVWAVPPYAPPYGSERFYPYFLIEFYEVDGERHPQSLVEREIKLQDEYASLRSNGAEVRERSVPKTVFNSGQVDPEEAKKLSKANNLEMVGLRLTDPLGDVGKAVAVVAAPRFDPMLYDTSAVLRDMNFMSGVDEAAQNSPQPGVTATAEEKSRETATSRTGSDRDALEDMLNDLAFYTLEQALQALTFEDVKRIAGPLAFWPEGMAYEELADFVVVEIVAGSTGKPQMRADKETWATLLPLVQNAIVQITTMEATGNPAVMAQAKGLRALLRETLKRLDDRLSIDQILPPMPAPLIPPAAAGAPGAMPGQLPPTDAAGGNLPPVGNGTINKPPTPPAAA
jgi:hypothetical protein